MHIGVDATCWQNRRGYGRHARALLRALVRADFQNYYTLFTDSILSVSDLPARTTVANVAARTPAVVAAAADGHRSLLDMTRMSRALSSARCKLLLFPTIYTYVPVTSRARKIVVIHDTIAETHPELTLPTPTARLLWKAKVFMGRLQADAIVTVSNYSRRKLAERYRMDPARIAVVGEAANPVFRREAVVGLSPCLEALGLRPGRRYVVYLGGFGPHKNVGRLLEAFGQLVADGREADVDLVLVGDVAENVYLSEFPSIQAKAVALGLTERVVFTGFLADEELVRLLNLAAVTVLPSLMEGFGLPAVEAAACGCAVIATRESPLPEVLGEGGLYFDPLDTETLGTLLARVLGSEQLRRSMSAAGLAASQKLSWDTAAVDILVFF
jgi:alpha-1,3-rhamnosyl/mannosyltransferase